MPKIPEKLKSFFNKKLMKVTVQFLNIDKRIEDENRFL
jgi:hypothetical protein